MLLEVASALPLSSHDEVKWATHAMAVEVLVGASVSDRELDETDARVHGFLQSLQAYASGMGKGGS